MSYPNLKEEKKLWKAGYRGVVGLDEAGRGALAAPVVAAAVTVSKFSIFNFQFSNIRDSKQLSAARREELYQVLLEHPQIEWGIGRVGNKVIDRINIFEATKLAMERAVKNLEKKLSRRKLRDSVVFTGIDYLIIDGNFAINTSIEQKSIIKADEKVFLCAAASIIAKVTRDRAMLKYHKKHPRYGFTRHKGYPTKKHIALIAKHGPCQIHRMSFNPLKI